MAAIGALASLISNSFRTSFKPTHLKGSTTISTGHCGNTAFNRPPPSPPLYYTAECLCCVLSVPRWCVNGVTDSGGEPSEMDGEPLQLKAYKNELPLDDPRYLYIDKGDVAEIVLENGWALNRVNEQRESCLSDAFSS